MHEIKIKLLHPDAVVPSQTHDGDAAYDITAVSKEYINTPEYGYVCYKTGLSFEFSPELVGLLFSRSSVSKTGHILSNGVGVLDSNYRGEVEYRFKHVPHTAEYNVGDRIGQILFIKKESVTFVVTNELTETDRGNGGFGSTGI